MNRKTTVTLPQDFAACAPTAAVFAFIMMCLPMPAAADERTGIVVEEVAKGSVEECAGIRVGDVLRSWERAANPPANPDAAKGDIGSVFDWMWAKQEQSPRGSMRINGERGGEQVVFDVPAGSLEITVRPRMSEQDLAAYLAGKAAIASRDTAKGVSSWRQIATNQSAVGDASLACWIDLQIGNAHAKEKRWQEAQQAFQSALANAEASADTVSGNFVRDAMAKAYDQQNEPLKAEEMYRAVMTSRKEKWGECLGQAESLYGLGDVARRAGRLDEAEEILKTALAIREKLAPGSPITADSIENLAGVAYLRGDLASAEELVRRSLAIRQKFGADSSDVAYALGNLGTLAMARGDLAGAEGHMRGALSIFEKRAPGSPQLARVLNNLGMAAQARGDTDLAAIFYQRALAIKEKALPGSLDVASSLNNLGEVALNRHDLTAAEAYFKKSLSIKQKLAPDSPSVAISLTNLGDVAKERGDLATADDYCKQALSIRERLAPGSLEVAVSLQFLGETAQARRQMSAAEDNYRRALAIRGKLAPGSMAQAETLHALGLLRKATGHPSEAGRYLASAVDALESQIGKLGGSLETRLSFSAAHVLYYRDYVQLLVESGRPADAFAALERSRARGFLAMLAERDILFSDIPRGLALEQKKIASDYDKTQSKIAGLHPEKDHEQIDSLLARLDELRRKREDIVERVRRESPRLASLQYPKPLTLRQAQSGLDSGTLLLSYCVTENKTFIFAVRHVADVKTSKAPNPDGISVFTVPFGEEELRKQVLDFRALIQQAEKGVADSTALLRPASVLYDEMLKPAETLIASADRLLVCPDGPLHVLPYGALIRWVTDRGAKTPMYLIQWKPVHVALSATVYAELRERRPNPETKAVAPARMVAFGDPLYPAAWQLSPDTISNSQAQWLLTRGYDLKSLPATRNEVERITDIYRGNATAFLGQDATEEHAKAVGKDCRYIHFACHGICDEKLPLDSSLVLTIPEKPTPGQENGFLQAWEIFERVRIDADLVTLSACNSAMGKELGGEGLIGLTRAFQYAGARSVLASLWDVSDQTTAELMARFYGYLKAGKTKDEALRAAQIDLITSPAKFTAHPYHWAAFQLIGDWR